MQAPSRVRQASPCALKVVVLGGGRAAGLARVEDRFVDLVSDVDSAGSVLRYGQCGFSDRLAVHLYGMPPQQRYWFMWDALSAGAVAALVLADASRLGDCYPALDYVAARGLPHLVAVTGAQRYQLAEVRQALAVGAEVPVLLTESDRPRPAREVLHALVRYAIARRNSTAA
ncbi:ATP/GTP-binding protein [Actinocatenispora comari]|uniref:ATP/GTP-binding protein n=1 Tax=Actinocatenispora comari TaxID=2807577 RepID=UPI001A939987|nr:ATP/GTP-binding protein [Actinocatenispora comari]